MEAKTLLKTVIEPNAKNAQYWKDIWRYKGLAAGFAKRDITVRYKQTVIGLGWSVISPIVTMLMMSFLFGRVAKLPSDGSAPYPIMVYAGLIAWNLFARSLTVAASGFLTNADLLKKVYFPRIIAPLGQAAALYMDALISLGVLFVMLAIFKYPPPWTRLFLLPVFMLLSLMLGFCAGLVLAPCNIKHRDLNQSIPFLIQIGQYVTPVVYSFTYIIASLSPKAALFYMLNPVAGAVNAFKWCIIGSNGFHLPSFLITLAWLGILLPLGIFRFRKGERTFVDLV
ncbi:MAG TPA: ABC transporter permease [Clostridia bacterium]|nr:ABC transporter permease [Clostridia bacterium]